MVNCLECRKIRPTKCMGSPHPDVEWHKDLYLWVGPDGHPVKREWEDRICKERASLLSRQKLTSKRSKALKEIKVLGEKLPEFPLVIVDPEVVTVD